MDDAVVITRAGASVEDVARVARDGARVELDGEVQALVRRSRAIVDDHVHGERLIYGLNTGLGHMRNERVPLETLKAYQEEMIIGHAGATGEPLPDDDVRAMIFARLAGAARGGAGLHPDSVTLLGELLNRRVHPVVPRQGSVGAADLMHLAAVAMVMIGRGHARVGGQVLPGAEALAAVGLAPYSPLPKEGLALLSANAASIGLGALVVRQAEVVATLADLAGALSLESYNGNPSPWREDAVRAKPFAGQVAAGASMRAILEGSYLLDPASVVSVQDPLSFRVMPQVHGALRDQLAFTRHAVEVELNSIGDNPMVCVEAAELISTGNFHPMTMALGFDALRVGIGHVGLLSERRMQKGLSAWFAARNTSEDAVVDGRPT
ncbi:MAG: Histidine ammonia-lyase, partial [uncultured Thermoleophilia bacterium]